MNKAVKIIWHLLWGNNNEISFDLDNPHLAAVTGVEKYTVTIAWSYESGNDTLDTYWGERAYTFINETVNEPCIRLDIKIKIQQDEQ